MREGRGRSDCLVGIADDDAADARWAESPGEEINHNDPGCHEDGRTRGVEPLPFYCRDLRKAKPIKGRLGTRIPTVPPPLSHPHHSLLPFSHSLPRPLSPSPSPLIFIYLALLSPCGSPHCSSPLAHGGTGARLHPQPHRASSHQLFLWPPPLNRLLQRVASHWSQAPALGPQDLPGANEGRGGQKAPDERRRQGEAAL